MGALATVALGLILADHIRESADASRGEARASVPATIANPASIAVLPMITFSANPGREYISDSLTEALITDLARIDSLEVTSRTSAMQYKGQTKLVPEIGRELGVAYVLEGSVVEADGRIRVTAQLIDARTDLHVWTDTYDRKAGDVLSWQDEVSARIARAVHSALSSKRSAGVSAGPSSSAATTP